MTEPKAPIPAEEILATLKRIASESCPHEAAALEQCIALVEVLENPAKFGFSIDAEGRGWLNVVRDGVPTSVLMPSVFEAARRAHEILYPSTPPKAEQEEKPDGTA